MSPRITVYADGDEWYPVYEVTSKPDSRFYDAKFQVEAATLERWQRAERVFRAVQAEIAAKVDKHWRPLPSRISAATQGTIHLSVGGEEFAL